MRTGKISENVLKRSILKRCKAKQENMVQGPGVGRDCAIFHVEEKSQLMTSVEAVAADSTARVRQVICHAANNLVCGGSKPMAVNISILLPADAEEGQLRELIDAADACCQELGMALAGGHTEVSEAVNLPIVTVCSMGIAACQEKSGSTDDTLSGVCPGLDLVMTGFAGMEGTALLARAKEQELLKKFPLDLVATASQFDEHLFVGKEARIALDCGAKALHDVSQGGVFGAFWELCERDGIGMEAELKKIPLKQETVEICEVFGLNPYCLLSGGALLAAVEDGQHLVMELAKEGIPAVLIGRTTEKKDKVLLNGEECRFLEKPAQDEICKICL